MGVVICVILKSPVTHIRNFSAADFEKFSQSDNLCTYSNTQFNPLSFFYFNPDFEGVNVEDVDKISQEAVQSF